MSLTIGISPVENEDWGQRALAQEPARVRRDGDRLTVSVPPKLLGFYVWENSSYDASAVGDLVMITLGTRVPIAVRGEADVPKLESSLRSA
jgi:hypothetical protein